MLYVSWSRSSSSSLKRIEPLAITSSTTWVANARVLRPSSASRLRTRSMILRYRSNVFGEI